MTVIFFDETGRPMPPAKVINAEPGSYRRIDTDVRELALSYLDREDEDWTWVDPEDVKLLARAVLARK